MIMITKPSKKMELRNILFLSSQLLREQYTKLKYRKARVKSLKV